MKNFIQELYYGNIEAQELNSELKAKLKSKLKALSEKEELLKSKLSAEEKQLFISYVDASNEFSSLCNSDCFMSGFRLGAKFAYDTFINN